MFVLVRSLILLYRQRVADAYMESNDGQPMLEADTDAQWFCDMARA